VSSPVRVLLVQNGDLGTAQVEEELRRSGYNPETRLAGSAAILREALSEDWDVIIVDHACSALCPPDVLRILREKGLDVPVIVLGAGASEEEVQDALKAGAADVLGKGELSRLPVAAAREMRAAEGRRERRSLEEQFRHAQKLEAVGRLAGGVAHDFNNLLTIISGYSELLLSADDLNESHRMALDEIRRAAQRGGALAHSLLAFSRRQPLAARVVHINPLLMGMEKMLRRLIGEDIELVVLPVARRDAVKTDPGQLEQVIMNIVVNARDAMPRGGKLTVEINDVVAEDSPGIKAGPYVLLTIADTGMGMDAETRSHVFEPFFTTKAPGKGTGLGLATAYGIVTQSGGAIAIDSVPGHGTTVRIHLPLHAGKAESDASEAASGGPTGRGCETILVVEDEPRLRKLLRGLLAEKGYGVLEAARGDEAIRIVQAYPGNIDLVILDVVMPELSGPEVGRKIALMRPETRLLYMSGYLDEALVHHGVLSTGSAFLQKPFLPNVLTAKIREILDVVPRGQAGGLSRAE